MALSKEKRYAHDCTECIWLGTYGPADLYFHPGNGSYQTVIARCGNEPSDYSSGLAFVDVHPGLGEAAKRAKAMGLLP